MASATATPPSLFFFVSFFFFFVVPSISAVDTASPTSPNASDFIRTSCNATLYPDLCYSSLSRYAVAVRQDPAQLARIAVAVSLAKARRMAAYVSGLSRQLDAGAGSGTEPRAQAALKDCFDTLGDAVDEISQSLGELRHLRSAGAGREAFMFQMSNVQTWMSAALTNEDTCTDGFEMVSDGPVKSGVCDRATKVKKFTSNALALVNSFAAKEEEEEEEEEEDVKW